MNRVKYKSKEYKKAYEDRSLAEYENGSYNLLRPLPEVTITPAKNLDLGQVVRNGTEPLGRGIGTAVIELSALHPIVGLAKASVDAKLASTFRDKILSSVSAFPIPFVKNLTKTRKIVYPVTKKITKINPETTRISLHNAKKDLGYIDLAESYEKTNGMETVFPEYIKVNDPGKGLSPALYATGIKDMKKPIKSGEVLLEPNKTTRIYKYFEGPELPPLINDEGYNYPIKIMIKPKNPNLYKDTIEKYQEKTAKYTDNLTELLKLFKHENKY